MTINNKRVWRKIYLKLRVTRREKFRESLSSIVQAVVCDWHVKNLIGEELYAPHTHKPNLYTELTPQKPSDTNCMCSDNLISACSVRFIDEVPGERVDGTVCVLGEFWRVYCSGRRADQVRPFQGPVLPRRIPWENSFNSLNQLTDHTGYWRPKRKYSRSGRQRQNGEWRFWIRPMLNTVIFVHYWIVRGLILRRSSIFMFTTIKNQLGDLQNLQPKT